MNGGHGVIRVLPAILAPLRLDRLPIDIPLGPTKAKITHQVGLSQVCQVGTPGEFRYSCRLAGHGLRQCVLCRGNAATGKQEWQARSGVREVIPGQVMRDPCWVAPPGRQCVDLMVAMLPGRKKQPTLPLAWQWTGSPGKRTKPGGALPQQAGSPPLAAGHVDTRLILFTPPHEADTSPVWRPCRCRAFQRPGGDSPLVAAVNVDQVDCLNAIAYRCERNLAPVRRPRRQAITLVVEGQLSGPLGVRRLDEELRVPVSFGDEGNCLPVRRPGRPVVPGGMLSDVEEVTPLIIHRPDFAVPAAMAGERDATGRGRVRARRRPGGIPVTGWVVGQPDRGLTRCHHVDVTRPRTVRGECHHLRAAGDLTCGQCQARRVSQGRRSHPGAGRRLLIG